MGWPCPTCERELTTRRGMRQHHTKVHGDPLPNRTCSGCGTRFHDTDAKREYCEACDPNAGEHNGNYQDALATTDCERCGASFEYYPSDKEGVYCGSCVENGEGLTELGTDECAERTTVVCEQCGDETQVLRSRYERTTVRFCGRECRDRWLSSEYRGERHHSWKGEEVKYGGDWWDVRRQARERDDFTCQNCGVTKSELGQNPDVHHIEPIRTFEDRNDAHTLDNVVTLCPSCHNLVEHGSVPLPDGPWK